LVSLDDLEVVVCFLFKVTTYTITRSNIYQSFNTYLLSSKSDFLLQKTRDKKKCWSVKIGMKY